MQSSRWLDPLIPLVQYYYPLHIMQYFSMKELVTSGGKEGSPKDETAEVEKSYLSFIF